MMKVNSWLCVVVVLMLTAACGDDAAREANNGTNSGNNNITNKSGNKVVAVPWTGTIDGVAVNGKTAMVNVQENNTMFSFQAVSGSGFTWLEILVDDVDHDSNGTFLAVTTVVSGGVVHCDFQRSDPSTLNLTIDYIEQSEPSRPPRSSKGNFEGTIKCDEGNPIAVQGSWDY